MCFLCRGGGGALGLEVVHYKKTETPSVIQTQAAATAAAATAAAAVKETEAGTTETS